MKRILLLTTLFFVVLVSVFAQHPVNLQTTNITPTTADFTYDGSVCSAAINFRIKVSGTSNWFQTNGVGVSSWSLSNLTPGESYAWAVKCVGTGGWSANKFFQTLPTTYNIETSGFDFIPDTILCAVGDTIGFLLGATHDAVEVSQANWLANQATSNGGFDFPSGDTTHMIASLAQTYYYVCTPHVGMGMKGVIIAGNFQLGCTDVTACNYDPAAITDDGSCVLPDGCTDSLADNYDALATCDDGSCTYIGCTDATACNYNPAAITDDGSCVLPDGCTDSLADNYDALATCDDGSCIFSFPVIDNIFIIQELLCYNDSIGEVQVDITQTTPSPTDYKVLLVQDVSAGYYVAMASTGQSSGNQVIIGGLVSGVDYVVRLVDSIPYYTANPFGNGFSNVGIFDEWPITINFTNPSQLTAGPIVKTDPTCFGDSDGTAEVVSPVGGTLNGGSYSYQWDDPLSQTTQIATGLLAGTYSCIVTDANACSDTTADITIINPPALVIDSIAHTDITCNDFNDGTAEVVNPVGGTLNGGSYSYQWDDPLSQTTQIATGLSQGVYNCTIKDSNDCVITETSATIINPSVMSAGLIAKNDISCNDFNDGIAIVPNASGGTPSPSGTYNYLWSDGQTDSIANGLLAGIYSCIVTDANGCPDTTANITIINPPALGIDSIVKTDITCNGDGDGTAIVVNPNGGTLNGLSYSYLWDDPLSQTTQTATGLSGGAYTCIISDDNGCLIADFITIIDPAVITADTAHTDITCHGDNDGTALVLNPSGGTPWPGSSPYSYEWSDALSQTSTIATGLSQGIYSCIITDQNGCSSTTFDVTVINPSLITADPTIHTDITCSGVIDGTATVVNPSGGTPFTGGIYNYLWSDGQTTQTAVGLPGGIYTPTIIDANGCSYVASSVSIAAIPELIAITDYSNISCTGDADGEITITVTGGTPFLGGTYNYLWNTGDVTASINGLSAGTYVCTITDATGCSITSSTITITNPSPLQIDSVLVTPITCNGANDALIQDIQVTGGTPAADPWMPPYEYSLGGGTSWVPNVSYFPNFSSGTYNIQVKDANDCVASDILIINEPDVLDVNITTSLWNNYQIRCHGNTSGWAIYNVTGGSVPYLYAASDGSGNSWPFSAGADTVDNLPADTYTFEVLDANGCLYSEVITFYEPDPIIHNFMPTHVTCSDWNNGSLIDSVSGGVGSSSSYNYLWDTGETTYSLIDLAIGTYTITVTDQNNCVSVASYTINDDNALSASTSVIDVSCFDYCDGEITVNVTGGVPNFNTNGDPIYNYQWNDTLFQTTQTAIGLCVDNNTNSTTYECIVSDMQGCVDTLLATVNQPTELSVSASVVNHVLCFNGSTGKLNAVVSGGSGNMSYLWSNNSTPTGPANNGVPAGDYVITVTDDQGCSAADFITITEPTELTLSLTHTNVSCFGFNDGGIEAVADNGTPFLGIPPEYLYTVTDVNGVVIYSQTKPIGLAEDLTPGIYEVSAEDMNGCKIESGTIYISEPGDSLSITFNTVDASCLQNNGSATVVVYGGTPNNTGSYQYNWDNSVTTATNTGLLAGYYPITVVDSRGCDIRDSAFVKGTQNVFADSLSEITYDICLGDSVFITVDETPFNTYVWEDGSVISDRWVFPDDYTNVYTLTINDPTCNTTYQVFATVNVEFIDPLPVSDPIIEYGNFPIVLAGEDLSLSSDNNNCVEYTWQWSDNTISNNNGSYVVNNLEKSDWYYLYVRDSEGCLGYDSIYVVVGVKPYEAITPNNDGFNDTWTPLDIESYENADVQVFNRWGGLVFESKGGENYQPWDGTNGEKELVVGTYYYIIDLNNGDEPQTGPITIIR